MNMSRSSWILFTTLSSVSSFLVSPPYYFPARRHLLEAKQSQRPSVTTPLRALIYGWDDGDDDDSTPVETSFRYETELAQCSVEGVAVAESIVYDPDRLGSLARLAVAFSPPERALQLDQIERVDVLCVSQKHIDLQAVICEDGGCVTLAVPIKFPKACDVGSHLEGCVIRHLEEFDTSSVQPSSPAQLGAADEINAPFDMNARIEYPSWWEAATSYEMVSECEDMVSILNEEEFQPEVLALVQEAIQKDGQGLVPTVAKVHSVGPAGFCFKVRARSLESTAILSLDVFSPFGGTSKATANDLRAAILGTVATAGGSPA
jgi:hypothetical protein